MKNMNLAESSFVTTLSIEEASKVREIEQF